jgi:hypothetical protein
MIYSSATKKTEHYYSDDFDIFYNEYDVIANDDFLSWKREPRKATKKAIKAVAGVNNEV